MNPGALWFASGDSLYAGAALLLLVICISPYLKHRWLLRLRNVGSLLALAIIALACPPFPWAVDVMFMTVFALWFVAWNQVTAGRIPMKLNIATAAALFVLLLILPSLELAHRTMPRIAGVPCDHLVVIGDSISSGIDSRVAAWPVVMQQMTGVPVKNLALPGAQTMEGLGMASKVTPEDRIVLIEIGGNDLLNGVPPQKFGQALEAILSRLVAPGRTIVMFELPLLPNTIAYGQIQRRLAAKYGIWLIPKRFFTYVIYGPNATVDGLHLSDVGAHRMAALVAHSLSAVLKIPTAAQHQ